jgi:molecular chaperone GrpE
VGEPKTEALVRADSADAAVPDVAGSEIADEAEAAASPELAAVRDLNASLDAVFEAVSTELKGFHSRAAAQEDLIAKMHARIEVLQQGETKKLLKPVSTQLIGLYSDIVDTTASLGPDTTVDQFTGLLSNFSLTVEQILDNLGLASLETSPGDEFDPRLHQAVKKIDTTDAASDRKIVTVLRQGFGEPGEAKPTVPSRVSVYRLVAESIAATTPSPTDSGERQ